ncbi:hemagglutinin/amebocyte aggregation factor [Plakobranchus ocellatus]|uniref:Hemagglutinin/amebocyte aggregation factor n=1 Tax=Plakobranchus ocellatus TaxID=259542 RepID=A0AAV3Z770_9GAST|nr:hemagglutinin/amebocyte aggregation factor [Plakobranchus ocellatus]
MGYIVVFLIFNAVLTVASSKTIQDANKYDHEVKFTCPSNQFIKNIQSDHNDRYEDRTWAFRCAYVPAGATLSECSWSGYVNTMSDPANYNCHDGGIITGWKSYHSNKEEDRATKYRCCKAKAYLTHTCQYTGFFNDWDGVLNYRVPNGWVLTGVFSHYLGSKRDRRFNFNICQLDLEA